MQAKPQFHLVRIEPEAGETAMPSSLRNTIVLFRRVLDHSAAGFPAARVEAMARTAAQGGLLPPHSSEENSLCR